MLGSEGGIRYESRAGHRISWWYSSVTLSKYEYNAISNYETSTPPYILLNHNSL